MREKYNICEDLSFFLNTNISIIECEDLEVSKNIIFNVPNSYELNKENLEEIKLKLEKNNVLCILEEKIKIGYLSIMEKGKKFFIIIGPFLIEKIENSHIIQEIRKTDEEVYEFYKNLKEINITSYQILINIVEGLINKDYERRDKISFEEFILEKKIRKKDFKRSVEEINYKSITQRYLYENLMLDNIKNGNIEKALFYDKKLSNEFDMASRMPFNQLRAKKNGAYIGAGMIRKLVEELKIPFVKIHLISSKYFYEIENSSSVLELNKVRDKMIEEYSKMCLEQRENSNLKGIVNKALFYIDINLEKNIKVSDIANYCGVSLEHLSRVFKEDIGINLKKYINGEKIKLSMKFLKNKNYEIKDIAIKLDFSSTEIYVKNFKSIMGITPTEYRKNLKLETLVEL